MDNFTLVLPLKTRQFAVFQTLPDFEKKLSGLETFDVIFQNTSLQRLSGPNVKKFPNSRLSPDF